MADQVYSTALRARDELVFAVALRRRFRMMANTQKRPFT